MSDGDAGTCAHCGAPIPPRLDPRGRRAKYCSAACRAAASRKRAAARHAADLEAARAATRPVPESAEDRFLRAASELIEEMRAAPVERLHSQRMRDVAEAARSIADRYQPPPPARPARALSRQQRRAAARRRR